MADEILWADADIAREQTLEMEWRQTDRFRRVFKARLLQIVLGEIPDRAAHALPVRPAYCDGNDLAHGANMGRRGRHSHPNLAGFMGASFAPCAARISGVPRKRRVPEAVGNFRPARPCHGSR